MGGKGSGPPGNVNAKGKWGSRRLLTVHRLAKSDPGIYAKVKAFQIAVETDVLHRGGTIDVYRASLINSAARHEARALMLSSYINAAETDPFRVEVTVPNVGPGPRPKGQISLADRLTILREIGQATAERDKCLERLNCHKSSDGDVWAQVDAGLLASPTNGLASQSTGLASPRNADDVDPPVDAIDTIATPQTRHQDATEAIPQ